MGINIIPYVIGDRVEEEYPGGIDMYFEKSEYEGFDSIRCVGDSDFVFSEEIEWVWLYDNPDEEKFEHSYRRPKNIDLTIEWVKNNNPKSYGRLIKLLEAMKQTPKLWIKVSY